MEVKPAPPAASTPVVAKGSPVAATQTRILRVQTANEPTSPNIFLMAEATGIAKKHNLGFE
ncbi:MAG: hypothetical protein LBT86_07320 [Deltaproteobacteria bacterium]|nr:hypothetical protein [Deltaproteobacteria bacterium]